MSDARNTIPQEDFIRHKLFSGESSIVERYAALSVGGTSYGRLIAYELITSLFGHLPGALGLALRKLFYPLLFRRVGKGVVFGRSLTIRNPQNIVLGDRVLIDDYCLLDARGGGAEGIVIGEQALVHRGVLLQARAGAIRVGAHSDIGAGSAILTQGEAIDVGEMVSIGGGCKIGGGSVRLAPAAATQAGGTGPSAANDFATRGQERVARGGIRIEDRSVLAMGVTVLDGVTVGAGTVVGAGAVLRQPVPPNSAVLPQERLAIVSRDEFGRGGDPLRPTPVEAAQPQPGAGPAPATTVAAFSVADGAFPDRLEPARRSVLRAVAQVNDQLPRAKRIAADPAAPLVEPDGPLDSLGLINLIVALEDVVLEELGVRIAFVDALSADTRPFATVGGLVSYVGAMLERPA